ncbi:sulfate adenylyltransferase [Endozoicomonas sp. (ex Bugula neritina AB1)]|nr:sulfate adenylyltransferase [Endozoicomonas sp. (ex Bugula neritina AB1)]
MLSHLLNIKLIHLLFAVALAGEFIVSKALLERVRNEYGFTSMKRLESWQNMVSESQGLEEAEKLRVVNHFFNQMRFVSDLEHWGKNDFWATPVEFLASGGGDCEDFSIAKYFTLRELGVADSKLRITYVKAIELNQAHMVLSYFAKPGKEPLILDNLKPEIKPASTRKDLVPVYNFNGDGLWLSRQKGNGVRVGESDRIKLWTDLRERLTLSTSQGRPVNKTGKLP